MNEAVTSLGSAPESASGPMGHWRVVVGRLAILMLLAFAAFREEWRVLLTAASRFSEWSHVFALPLAVGVFCWFRREDLRAAATGGSGWGLVLIFLGVMVWFATKSLGLFGYLTLIAMLMCLVGAVLATCGARFFRTCIPALLMLMTCLPLSERSMERFSLAVQRLSLAGGAVLTGASPGVVASPRGLTVAVVRQDRGEPVVTSPRVWRRSLMVVGQGEQRFGFRLVPACTMIGLLVVFSCRRPTWQVILLLLAAVPLVILSNVIRVAAVVLTTVYGGYSPLSNVPRNVSIAVGLLAAYLLFGTAVWAAGRLQRMESLFYVDDESADNKYGACTDAPSGEGDVS